MSRGRPAGCQSALNRASNSHVLAQPESRAQSRVPLNPASIRAHQMDNSRHGPAGPSMAATHLGDQSFDMGVFLVTASSNKLSNVNSALNQPSHSYEPLIDEKQAAQFLGGLHPKTVQRMARRGELPHCRIGKYYRFRASELDAWIQIHSRGQINPPAQTRKEIQ